MNVVVLWNTLYMSHALERLRELGRVAVAAENVARLSPLEHRNVNFLGQYSFGLAPQISRGDLRPLRTPSGP